MSIEGKIAARDRDPLPRDTKAHRAGVEAQNEELREKQRGLEVALAKYAAFFDLAPVCYLLHDDEGQIVEANLAAVPLFGVEAAALVGTSLQCFVDSSSRAALMAHLRQVRLSGSRADARLTLSGPAGALPVEMRTVPMRGGDGLLQTAITDLSLHKGMEQTVREGEERLRAQVTAVSQVLYRMSPDWRVMYELHSTDFLVGTAGPSRAWLEEYIPADEQARVEAAIEDATRRKDIFELEHRVRRTDGSTGWVLSRAVPVTGSSGEVLEWFGAATDITQRKGAEEELRHTHEKLQAELKDSRLLQEVSAALIHEDNVQAIYQMIADAAAGIMHSEFACMQTVCDQRDSAGALRLLAFRGFDLQTAHFWEWMGADSPYICGQALRLRSRCVVADVQSWPSLEGAADREKYLRAGIRAVQSTPLITRSGKLVGILSTHWASTHHPSDRDWALFDILARQAADLIERKEGEMALRASEERYRMLFQHSLDAIFLTYSDGRIIAANPAARSMLGLTEKEICRAGRNGLVEVADPRLDAALEERRRTGKAAAQISLRGKGGRLVPVEVESVVLPDGTDRSFVIARDISQKVAAEKELRQSEERFRKIFEEGPLGACICDLDYRFVKVNRRLCDMLGYRVQELCSLSFMDITDPQDAQVSLSKPQLLLGGELQHFNLEKRYLHKKGSAVWVSVTAWLMRNEQGDPSYFIATVEDISEKKRMQEHLIWCAKRDERTKAMKTIQDYQERLRLLASKLSLAQEEERRRIAVEVHDSIGQNLAFCKLKVGLLQQRHPELTEELGEVISSVDRCISSSRSLSFELTPAVLFDLGLEPALQWLACLQGARHGIAVTVSADCPYPLPLPSRILLFQSAREFIANAVKHAKASRAEISLAATKRGVSVTVRDDGTGFVLPETGSVPDSTRGFGLFSVQEQLRNLGGVLTIESAPGAGTIAKASLPLATGSRRRKK